MYLTDYRERCLKDVITQLEPGLFKKVTGLNVSDFELLVSLGVFNDSLMNDAVYKFKRYEDASLSYTGINRHEGENRGGWDTVITDADYNKMFALQQASMEAPAPAANDLPENPVSSFMEAAKPLSEKKPTAVAKEPTPYKNPERLAEAVVASKQVEPVTPAPKKEVDLSLVKVGCRLRHKAFGMGVVNRIDHGVIVVAFGNAEKKFPFPGALLEGFLSLPE